MKTFLLFLNLILSCSHGTDTAITENTLCAMAEEGMKKGYLCDVGPLVFQFKDSIHWSEKPLNSCEKFEYSIRTNAHSLEAMPKENIVFIYSQIPVGDTLMQYHYMTYCAGARIEGQFNWNHVTSEFSEWKVVTIIK